MAKRKIQSFTGQVQLLAFTWQRCLETAGEGVKGKNPAPLNNQCSGSDELDSVANSYPRQRKISDLNTRADRVL